MIHIKRLNEMMQSSTLNEGAGAAYTVAIDNIKWNDVVSVKRKDDRYYEVVLSIAECDECNWYVESYYHAINAEQYISLTGNYDCRKIDGGTITCTVDADTVATRTQCEEPVNDSDVRSYMLSDIEDTLNISCAYGGGWSHSNLGEEFTLKGSRYTIENGENHRTSMGAWEYMGVDVSAVTIKSKTMGPAIDDYFENDDDYDDQLTDM